MFGFVDERSKNVSGIPIQASVDMVFGTIFFSSTRSRIDCFECEEGEGTVIGIEQRIHMYTYEGKLTKQSKHQDSCMK